MLRIVSDLTPVYQSSLLIAGGLGHPDQSLEVGPLPKRMLNVLILCLLQSPEKFPRIKARHAQTMSSKTLPEPDDGASADDGDGSDYSGSTLRVTRKIKIFPATNSRGGFWG